MFDGALGREPDDIDARGWNAGADNGDIGLRLPRIGESSGSDVGEAAPPLRERSSGVNLPFVLLFSIRGATDDIGVVTGLVGEVGLEVCREVEAEELLLYILEVMI